MFDNNISQDEERKKKPITYNCKWCKKQVRGGHNSDANLRKHRDGSNQTGRDGSGCPNRSLAIQAGAKIPPTVNETRAQAEKNDNGGPKLTAFFGRTEKFDKKILMIWQTRNALPWSRIEDFDLQAAFHYCQSDAILFKRKWVASEAKQLYVSLQGTMLQMLKVSFLPPKEILQRKLTLSKINLKSRNHLPSLLLYMMFGRQKATVMPLLDHLWHISTTTGSSICLISL